MEVIRIGINGLHYRNFQISRPNGYPHYLFLLIKTPAIFVIDDEEIKVEPSTAIIYDTNYPHYYSADNGDYINDWIHFNAGGGTDYFESLSIPLNTLIKVYDDTYVCEILRLMSNEYYSINTNKEQSMSLLLQAMFLKLSEVIQTEGSKKHTNVHYTKLIRLRNEIYSNPHVNWTVDNMAKKLNLCNTYLQKIYKETFGVSCISDVIACRIENAKDILSKTDLPISKIAADCGYNNDVHFMRQFKQHVGITPTDYRNNSFHEQ